MRVSHWMIAVSAALAAGATASSAVEQWNVADLKEYLKDSGQEVAQDSLDALKEAASREWEKRTSGSKSVLDLLWRPKQTPHDWFGSDYSNPVSEWLFNTWPGEELQKLLKHSRVKTDPTWSRDKLVAVAKRNFKKISETLGVSGYYPSESYFKLWDNSELKDWLEDYGIPYSKGEKARDYLLKVVRENIRRASDFYHDERYEVLTSVGFLNEEFSRTGTVDHVDFSSWPLDSLRSWLEVHKLKFDKNMAEDKKYLVSLAEKNKNLLMDDVEWLGSIAQKELSEILKRKDEAMKRGKDAAAKSKHAIKQSGEDAVQYGKDAGNAAMNYGKNVGKDAVNAGKDAVNAGKHAGKDAVNAGKDAVNAGKHAGKDAVNAGKDAVNAGKHAGKDAVNAGKKAGKDAVKAGKHAGKDAVDAGRDAVHDAVNAGKHAGKDAVDAGRDAVHAGREAGRDAVEAGRETGDSFVHHGKDMLHAGQESAESLWDSIKGYFNRADDVINDTFLLDVDNWPKRRLKHFLEARGVKYSLLSTRKDLLKSVIKHRNKPVRDLKETKHKWFPSWTLDNLQHWSSEKTEQGKEKYNSAKDHLKAGGNKVHDQSKETNEAIKQKIDDWIETFNSWTTEDLQTYLRSFGIQAPKSYKKDQLVNLALKHSKAFFGSSTESTTSSYLRFLPQKAREWVNYGYSLLVR
ncbi:AaceriADL360Cp [[Ashbya] aceris (nom. inval.)]|nr:AaceriADL360Cp [[Ashbya] aceris (nom. inval.)]